MRRRSRRLTDAQERWFALERGTMLPAFLRTPPPVFAVKPADAPVRVLAFGDFGNGSPEQKTVASTIAAYHAGQRFDLAVTLGDNFYSVGMESPSDPRWRTWFEELYAPLGITFFPALGNHDWGHPDSPAAEVLYTGRTPTWRMPAAYYTFTAGPVQFFAIDTQSVALAVSSATGSIGRSARARRGGRSSTVTIRSIRTATTTIGPT